MLKKFEEYIKINLNKNNFHPMLKYISVQHNKHRIVKKTQQTFMGTGMYYVSPLWWHLTQPLHEAQV